MSSYKTNQCPKMRKDFFVKLPSEMTIDILSRLSVRATVNCKCVCKSWLDLIKSLEFAESHFFKSAPGLAVFFQGEMFSEPYKVFEYVDDHGPEIVHRCNNDFNFSFPLRICINSSADGLLLLCDPQERPHYLFICNPVTREYIRIPGPQEPSSSTGCMQFNTFGFGASRTTGLYKVVRIYSDFIQLICQGYTLGTGSWRSIVAPGGPLVYEWISSNAEGVLLNGNLHWLAWDPDQSPRISCFDIETELFSTFESPHLEGYHHGKDLSLLGGYLCICDTFVDDKIDIWLMKEYGDEKSWTKQCIIISNRYQHGYFRDFSPIKVFKDGDMLLARLGCCKLFCYSSKTNTIRGSTRIFASSSALYRSSIVSYTPSFIPLKTLTTENVTSF